MGGPIRARHKTRNTRGAVFALQEQKDQAARDTSEGWAAEWLVRYCTQF